MLWVYQGLRQDFALKGLIHITVLRFCYSYVIHYLLLWERQEAKRVRERKTKRARKCMLCVQVGFELPQRWRGGLLNMKNVVLVWRPEDTQESQREHMDCINSITNHTATHITPLLKGAHTHKHTNTVACTQVPTEVSLCTNQQAKQREYSTERLV